MQLGMYRFKRLTNAFGKNLDNPLNMLSLYFVHYSFVRIHKSLIITPEMVAGIEAKLKNTACLRQMLRC